jgi:hypothetical protein
MRTERNWKVDPVRPRILGLHSEGVLCHSFTRHVLVRPSRPWKSSVMSPRMTVFMRTPAPILYADWGDLSSNSAVMQMFWKWVSKIYPQYLDSSSLHVILTKKSGSRESAFPRRKTAWTAHTYCASRLGNYRRRRGWKPCVLPNNRIHWRHTVEPRNICSTTYPRTRHYLR